MSSANGMVVGPALERDILALMRCPNPPVCERERERRGLDYMHMYVSHSESVVH